MVSLKEHLYTASHTKLQIQQERKTSNLQQPLKNEGIRTIVLTV